MREHEVPTHVQAEDRVLLWFTFPQIVAMTAVCALSYGAYSYAPVGPSEVRMAIAVILGLAGVVAVVGKIGGRRLPLVAADLLRFWLGARRYAGPPAQLVRSEPPAPVQSGPGPLRLMARRARRGLRRRPKENRKKRKEGERRNGRMPLRPHGWARQAPQARGRRGRQRQPGRYTGDQASQVMARRPGRRCPGVGVGHTADRLGRRALAGRDRVPAPRSGPRTKDIRRGATGVGGPGQGDTAGGHGAGPAGAGLRRPGMGGSCTSGDRRAWTRGSGPSTPSPSPASRRP